MFKSLLQIRRTSLVVLLLMVASVMCSRTATALIVGFPTSMTVAAPRSLSRMQALPASNDEEIQRQIEQAKALLAKTKAKMDQQEKKSQEISSVPKRTGNKKPLPFFAAKSEDKKKRREQLIKSKSEDGAVVADGEKMAQRSEEEVWESRSLLEVFENERGDATSTQQQLAERDVAASLFNLRKTLKTEDYKRIFDSKNRFIGEDN